MSDVAADAVGFYEKLGFERSGAAGGEGSVPMRREGDPGPREDRNDPAGRSQPIEEPPSSITPRRVVIVLFGCRRGCEQ